MITLLLATLSTSEIILIKSKSKESQEFTLEQKIDMLAWRTEMLAEICDELNYKIDALAQYVLELQNLKRVSHD